MFHKPAQVGDDETGLAQIHSFRQTENRTNTPFVAKNLKVLSRLNTYFFLIYQDVLHTKKYSIFDYYCNGTFDFSFILSQMSYNIQRTLVYKSSEY